ncbi:NAD(P)/FAD-dependent oxidoreductase [Alkalicoccus daliensis]|uniref:Amine oxidase domain-containing protein n=1 Tax=Alkalicoccus daliensis TaxID=745820 RepID=A0A1H0I238_9BACI|nr:FAD-dependent oxidoreductase [Alkalicoccus daliensis]SDO25200.1 hypothetical protein SAMN04488053_109133 [Alkalicoccus daliensis]
MDIAIIGGGIAGVFAAKRLKEAGHTPFIIEKSRSVGGRLATRRINEGKADHGAQFFTVRTKAFQKEVDEWLYEGWAKEWFRDKYPRYRGTNGMNSLLKNTAESLPVMLEEKIIRLESDGASVTLASENGELFIADAAIVTAPVPQILNLIEQSALGLSEKVRAQLAAGAYNPCLVGLFEMKDSITLSESGLLDKDLPEGMDKIISNSQKGISSSSILSVYMNSQWSTSHYQLEDPAVLNEITSLLSFLESKVISGQLKRWRYAEAAHVYEQPYLQLDNFPIYAAGDAFLSPADSSKRARIESAFLSGTAAADRLITG